MNVSRRGMLRIPVLMLAILFGLQIRAHANYAFAKAQVLYDIYMLISQKDSCKDSGKVSKYVEAFLNDPWAEGSADSVLLLDYRTLVNYRKCLNEAPMKSKSRSAPLVESEDLLGETPRGTGDGSGTGGLISSILNPGVSQSEILFAITDVLVERAKEELAIAYLDRMKEAFEKKISIVIKEQVFNFYLKNLLPSIYALIRNMPDNLNAQFGNTFKAAMEKDVRDLPDNIMNSVPSQLRDTKAYTIADIARYTYNGVRDHQHPAMIINDLNLRFYVTDRPFGNAVHLIDIVSEAFFRPQNKGEVWYHFRDLERLPVRGWNYFAALFVTENKTFLKDLGANVDSIKKDITRLKEFLNSVVSNLNALSEMVNEFRNLQEDASGYDDWSDNPAPLKAVQGDERIRPLEYARQFLDMIEDAMRFGEFLNLNFDEEEFEEHLQTANKVIEALEAASNKDYGQVAILSFDIFEDLTDGTALNAEVVKYVSLAADIAQAENVEDVKSIFESAMLPVGSYRIKRSTRFSVSLNSYAGVHGGLEIADHDDLGTKAAGFGGLYLPVGLALNWSKGTEKKEAGSFSIFLPVLDLGTLASYRIGADQTDSTTTESLPDVKFKHVFAPGLYLVYGFKNSPISIGGGGQIAPSLRNIVGPDNIVVAQAAAYRIGAFIAVDIPIFHFGLRGASTESPERARF